MKYAVPSWRATRREANAGIRTILVWNASDANNAIKGTKKSQMREVSLRAPPRIFTNMKVIKIDKKSELDGAKPFFVPRRRTWTRRIRRYCQMLWIQH
jgi:hypothetical protein